MSNVLGHVGTDLDLHARNSGLTGPPAVMYTKHACVCVEAGYCNSQSHQNPMG